MIPFKIHSHFSILRSYQKIDELVEAAVAAKYEYLTLTDYDSISGAVEFIKACKENKIKPILGANLNICHNGTYGYVTAIARNKLGYQKLVSILSNYKTTDTGIRYTDNYLNPNLIYIFSGPDSILANLDESGCKDILSLLSSQDVLFYVNIEDHGDLEEEILNAKLTPLVEENKILRANSVYYTKARDEEFQKIIICSRHKWTINKFDTLPLAERLSSKDFLGSSTYDIKDLLSHVEIFDIANKPNMPIFDKDINPDEYLTKLCREGWVARGLNKKIKDDKLKAVYVERIKKELATFQEACLSNYILVVRDMIMFARSKNIPVGLRGSSVGCLVAYLIGLINIDPVMPDPTLPYKLERSLLFDRFYSKYRNTKDHVSLPDIDIDVGINSRATIIDYLKNKYGHECVANIITFNRLDGRGAVKEVFRVLDYIPNSFNVANEITRNMVDTARIQDELEDIKANNEKYNVINFCIDNIKRVKEFYDEYTPEMEIAIKLSGTVRNSGQHAAGIVITNSDIKELFPISTDTESGQPVLAFEMEDAEYVGAVKFDILGVAALEKCAKIIDMINNQTQAPTIEIEGKNHEIVSDQ